MFWFWVPCETSSRFCSKNHWQMFLLVSGRHVGAQVDGQVSGQFVPHKSLPIFKQLAHGRSQDFSKGGSHWLIQRVLIRLSPEYCKLFAYKKAYKGGVTGTPGPPLATPMQPPRSFIHYRAKRAAKYINPRLNVIQFIFRSFIHYLPSLKIGTSCLGRKFRGASCLILTFPPAWHLHTEGVICRL